MKKARVFTQTTCRKYSSAGSSEVKVVCAETREDEVFDEVRRGKL